MADCGLSGNDSMCESTTAASSGSFIYAVPDILIQTILQHLSATDLCQVASCCRWLRDATNQDSLWRPLCQSRGWEHYGTTTDLAKIASYGPSEQATDVSGARDDSVTFRKDRIVTDDNTAGLTSTCRWKGVYMRAYHLERNWATNCSHFKTFCLDEEAKPHRRYRNVRVDGDLLAMINDDEAFRVYDIRKKTIHCAIRSTKQAGVIELRDDVVVVSFKSRVACAFDAITGKLLQTINGNWRYKNERLFFDGELVITYEFPLMLSGIDTDFVNNIYVWSVTDGQLQHVLAVDTTDDVCACYYNLDYRDKMVAAVYNDDFIRVWDARNGECLHKLKCPGDKSNVKLGDNVVVGFSKTNETCDIIIWSQDTGECQKVIREVPSRYWMYPNAQLVNNLILLRESSDLYIYNLRGELLTKMVNNYERAGENGSNKRVFLVKDEPVQGKMRTGKNVIFNATPNGLVRLFDVGNIRVMWIDDIRMIIYDEKNRRLLFYHYW